MASSFPSFASLFVLGAFLALASSSIATNEVIRKVCSRASDYRYCVDALYSDPRAPDADTYLLGYISFGMDYTNASRTLDYVSHLLKIGWSNDTKLVGGLKVCRNVYTKGVAALASALGDLDSETYYYLGKYADTAARGADKCKAALGENGVPAELEVRNRDMKSLSEICSLVSELLLSPNEFTQSPL